MTWHAAAIAVGLAFCIVIDLALCNRTQPVDARRRHTVVAPMRYQEEAKAAYAWSFVCPQ